VVIATRRNATRLLVGPVQAIAVGPDGVDKLKSGTDGAATLPEVFGRPRENADAAPAPDARQFDLRKDASNRQIVSPSTTSSDPFLSYR
jgi:hypothetical protein